MSNALQAAGAGCGRLGDGMARHTSTLTREEESPRVPKQEEQSRSGDHKQGQPCDPVIMAKSAGGSSESGQRVAVTQHSPEKQVTRQAQHTYSNLIPNACPGGGLAIPSFCSEWSQVSIVPLSSTRNISPWPKETRNSENMLPI